ncbi:hypothetical protein AX16_004327 [Volvariella volvacea WC 439]|nr:hypothetical protein AX16_004327 [Volvariella volvacea WC 439]
MADPFAPPPPPTHLSRRPPTTPPVVAGILPPNHPFFSRVHEHDAAYFQPNNLEVRHLSESIKAINLYLHFSTGHSCDEDMLNPYKPLCNHAELWCILEDGSGGEAGEGAQGPGSGEAIAFDVLPGVYTINPYTGYPDEELPGIVRTRVFRRTDWTDVDDRCLVVSEWRKEVAATGPSVNPDIKEEEAEPALIFNQPTASASTSTALSGSAASSRAWQALDGVFPSRGWQSKTDPPLTPLPLSKRPIPERKNVIRVPEGEVFYEYEPNPPPRPPHPLAVCVLEGPVQQDWTVWDFIQLILNKRRHKYRFANHGMGRAGCRHWVLAVCHDLEREGVLSPGYAFQAKEHLEGCHVPVYREDGHSLSFDVRWMMRVAKKSIIPGSFVELY